MILTLVRWSRAQSRDGQQALRRVSRLRSTRTGQAALQLHVSSFLKRHQPIEAITGRAPAPVPAPLHRARVNSAVPGPATAGQSCPLRQESDPAARCRRLPSTKLSGRGATAARSASTSGKMRARVDDRVDPVAAGLVEQPAERGREPGGIDRLTAQPRLDRFDQIGRAMPQYHAIGREFGGEPIDIGLAHRRVGAEHADHTRFADQCRRLDRGDGADDRRSSAARTAGSAIVEACCTR